MTEGNTIAMNAKEFYDEYGRAECKRVAEKAGTTLEYFLQFVYGQRRPGYELAEKLVQASDNRLDLAALMKSKKNAA